MLSGVESGAVILITDGVSFAPLPGIATRLREAGFTLITVAIGRRVERELLSSIASTSPGGEPLFFEIDEFDQIKEALIDIFVKSAGV